MTISERGRFKYLHVFLRVVISMGFKALHFSEVKAEEIKEKGVDGVQVRWLITKKDGAPNFAMRFFEISPNGHSPLHSHKWEHEVFILEGESYRRKLKRMAIEKENRKKKKTEKQQTIQKS